MNLPLSADPLPPDSITATETARLLKVSLKSVYRWVHRGRVRAWRLGGRIRLSEAEVWALATPVEPRGERPPAATPRQREARAKRTAEELRRLGLV